MVFKVTESLNGSTLGFRLEVNIPGLTKKRFAIFSIFQMLAGGFDFVKDAALLRGVREDHGGGIFDCFGIIRDDEFGRFEAAAFKIA